MGALTQDRETPWKEGKLKSYSVSASTKIYKGSMVAVDGDGFLVPAADSANLKIVGVAYEQIDNSSGADGAFACRVLKGHFKFAASSITQAMVGKIMYVVDDQTFDDAVNTNGVKAGRLVEYVSATEGWLEIEPASLGVTTADATDLTTVVALANAIKAKLNANFA